MKPLGGTITPAPQMVGVQSLQDVLVYRAAATYQAGTTYSFTVDLVPDYVFQGTQTGRFCIHEQKVTNRAVWDAGLPGKMRQTRAAPAASIHKTRYVTPPQPEKRCKLAGRTYGMPFVSLILMRPFRATSVTAPENVRASMWRCISSPIRLRRSEERPTSSGLSVGAEARTGIAVSNATNMTMVKTAIMKRFGMMRLLQSHFSDPRSRQVRQLL